MTHDGRDEGDADVDDDYVADANDDLMPRTLASCTRTRRCVTALLAVDGDTHTRRHTHTHNAFEIIDENDIVMRSHYI